MRRAPLPSLAQLLNDEQRTLALPEELTHYLCHVLRLDVGDHVELFDGEGLCAATRITHTSPRLIVEVREVKSVEENSHAPRLHLVSAIPKGDRWEWLIEKATELGVHTIHPLQTERSVVQIPSQKAAKKQQRWEQIAQGAARQSYRVTFPTITPQQKIAQLLSALDTPHTSRAHLIASIHHTHVPMTRALDTCRARDARDIYLWTGPEGGWTTGELEQFEELPQAHFVSLGPRVLRAETAAIGMLTIAQLLLGDLGEEELR